MNHKEMTRAKIRQLGKFSEQVEAGDHKATAAQVIRRAVRPLLEEVVWQQDRWRNIQRSWQEACDQVESQKQEIADLRERIAQLEDTLFHAREPVPGPQGPT